MYSKLTGKTEKIIIQDLKKLITLKPVNQKINIVLDEFNIFVSKIIKKKNLTNTIFRNIIAIIFEK